MARSARAHREAPELSAASPKLGEILQSIAVIDVVCAPRTLDVGVTEVVIHDPSSPPHLDAGAFVLGVGVRNDSDEAIELVRGAGEARAASVAIKAADAAPVTLRGAAEKAGVALLSLPDEMTWSQAHSLVRTAINSASGGEDDITSVPLGDLFALANALAAMFGGPVTIEDRQSRVLAYSSQSEGIDEPRRQTILGRQVPPEWLDRLEEAGVFKRLWGGEVVRYQAGPGFDLRPRIAIAVRAGDTILGSIWVAEGETPLGERAEDALREAGRIAALHMIRHRSSPDLERRSRGELLRSIFEREGSVEATAYGLDVRPDDTFAVLAFEPQSADEVEGALERERALDLVALYGEAFRQRSALVQLGRTIYMLLPGPVPERLLDLAEDIIGRARESLGVRLRCGIGSVVSHLRDVPRSREEADQVLRALAADPESSDIADFETAHGRVVFVELRDFAAERPHLRSRRIATLAEHDRNHGTFYVETLRLFLDAFGDIPAAARKANVHANTFRYRLRRLVELSGLDLDDPRERLLASLELQLRLEDP